ncbi:LysR family transcriptional regulator [Mesorhizobium sp. B2-4-14]|uniref:LysR family transcriptional regulator n=1 Tax=Mesorhizobium sp. B2-4-14 TaxID=2589935 RepID=UPI001126B92D|nr:LysR family transcriptional regulator [Mesorhizobium sp. B2-4-14]TPL11536.1 LysR family transcriptional regulator [Mesorhizobium sp. B2-4-14]
MTDAVDLSGMALFVKIVECGSLSAAGRLLGLPKATISRQLALMEQRMGAPLLLRSTRALSLTDTGRRYFERIRPIVHDAEQAQVEALAEHAIPSGTLKIAAPIAYGQHVLAPKLFTFLQRYPEVRIDLHLSDELVNVIAGGFDLVIRLGQLGDSDLVRRRLRHVDRKLVASPDYLDRAGTPRTVAELASHRGILTRTDLDHWTIDDQSIRIPWKISTSNMHITRDAACAGLGIALLPGYLADVPIAEGNLVRILPESRLDQIETTALQARSVTPSIAVKALIKHLV